MTFFRERKKVLGIGGAIVLLAAILFWRSCHRTAAAAASNIVVSVQVAKAERGSIANEISVVATLAAAREATVMPKVSAQIAQMALLKNRVVRAGDVIAVLESRDLRAQRAEAAGAVAEADASAHVTTHGSVPLTNAQDQKAVIDARAAVENARKTYERRQALFGQGGISQKELEASKLALTNAEDDLRLAESSVSVHRGVTNPGDIAVAGAKTRQARDRLANLDAQLGYTVIRAPFDGTVTEQFQFQGDLATPGTKLVTIADTSKLIARMQLSEQTASTLASGDSVRILPDETPRQTFTGIVTLVGRGVDLQSRSVEVWVVVPNPAGRLRPNGVARAIISARPVANAVVVPESAVTLDATNGNGGTVMVVDSQSVAHEVHVTTGTKSGGRVEITSGLRGGETVITEGNYGLPDGTKVAMARSDAAGLPDP